MNTYLVFHILLTFKNATVNEWQAHLLQASFFKMEVYVYLQYKAASFRIWYHFRDALSFLICISNGAFAWDTAGALNIMTWFRLRSGWRVSTFIATCVYSHAHTQTHYHKHTHIYCWMVLWKVLKNCFIGQSSKWLLTTIYKYNNWTIWRTKLFSVWFSMFWGLKNSIMVSVKWYG